MTTSAPSNSAAHGPRVRPSHATPRAEAGTVAGRRLRTTHSCPSAASTRTRACPIWPLPPGRTIFMRQVCRAFLSGKPELRLFQRLRCAQPPDQLRAGDKAYLGLAERVGDEILDGLAPVGLVERIKL